MQQYNETIVDQDITDWPNEARKALDLAAGRDDPGLIYGFWKSLENIFIVLLRSVVRYAKDEGAAFARDFSSEIRKNLVEKGAKTTTTVIISTCCGLLVALAARGALGFEWVPRVIEFLRRVSDLM